MACVHTNKWEQTAGLKETHRFADTTKGHIAVGLRGEWSLVCPLCCLRNAIFFVCRHEPCTFGRVHGPSDHMPYISPISCSLLHSSLWKVADKKKRKSAVLYAVLNYIIVFNIYILVSLDIFFSLSKFCFCYIMLLNFFSVDLCGVYYAPLPLKLNAVKLLSQPH